LSEGFTYAIAADCTETVDFLLKNGVKPNDLCYELTLQRAMNDNNASLLSTIIKYFNHTEFMYYRINLNKIFGNLELVKQMKDSGFNLNFNKGCLINHFARLTARKQFSNLLSLGADPRLLSAESKKRSKILCQ